MNLVADKSAIGRDEAHNKHNSMAKAKLGDKEHALIVCDREGISKNGKDRLPPKREMATPSALFSSPRTATKPQFKVIVPRSVHKNLLQTTKENSTKLKASKFAGASEAAARRIRKKESRGKALRGRGLDDPRAERTIFVGNIPSCCSRKDIKKLMNGHGSIETIRLRSIKVTTGEVPSMVAKRTHKQLQEGSTFNAYVVFSSVAEAKDCLNLNGTLIHGRHLRVDKVSKKTSNPQENQRSVFVGNLPFTADEEKLREVFSPCGDIETVRVVRDSKSGVGKGFGFVMFVDKAGVMFSIRQNKKLMMSGRPLRVSRYKGQQVPKQRTVDSVHRKKGRLVATKHVGKRRPDGTKNRLYRIPVSS